MRFCPRKWTTLFGFPILWCYWTVFCFPNFHNINLFFQNFPKYNKNHFLKWDLLHEKSYICKILNIETFWKIKTFFTMNQNRLLEWKVVVTWGGGRNRKKIGQRDRALMAGEKIDGRLAGGRRRTVNRRPTAKGNRWAAACNLRRTAVFWSDFQTFRGVWAFFDNFMSLRLFSVIF